MERCIDVSAYQGEISVKTFQNMKDDGIRNVIIRCSYTQGAKFRQKVDMSFAQNITNAYKAGMKIGVYHFSQAISETEAIEEAKFVIKTVAKYKAWIKLKVAIDWEFYKRLNSYQAGKMGKQRCKQILDAFCRTIRNAGYDPMVYANLSTLQGYLPADLYKSWPIWVAQYSSRCSYRYEKYMWQYSSTGRISGIQGNVDMDYIYQDDVRSPGTTYPGKLPKLPARGWFTSGDKGVQVQLLQLFLNWYFGYDRLDPDGEVGRLTMDAVRDFEKAEGLKVDRGAFGKECLDRARIVRR